MKSVMKVFIHAYRYLISPLLGPSCRFHPTCSAYALEAIDSHGALKGGFLAFRRLSKCHPWHKGPFIDPVPGSGVDHPDSMVYKRANPKTTTPNGAE